MALTLEAEQRLYKVSLIAFYENDKSKWDGSAKEAYKFVQENFPDTATVRRDDVAKALVPVLEVSEELTNQLNKKKLQQKFWIQYFADLIIDRCWVSLGDGT